MTQTSVPLTAPGKALARGNRRASIRYRCAPATIGKIFAADDQEFQRAWIINLSLSGIGIQIGRPIDAGRIVIVTMKTNDGAKTIEMPALVMHCSALPQGEWYIGCQLTTHLSPEELDQLL